METCDQYGKNGKTDFGVDLRAILKNQSGLLLAQCKAYQQFPAAKIKSASNAFFKHWNQHWKDRQVKRFLLIVGCNVEDTTQQDEIDRQRERFAARGISFECWSASTLVTVLQPHREIVERYFGTMAEYWIRFICGQSITQTQSSNSCLAIDPTFTEQIAQLSVAVSHDTKALLEQAIARWKEGEVAASIKAIDEVQSDAIRWAALNNAVKAEIVNFRGKVALEQNDPVEADKQATEAEKLGEFSSTSNLRALIALYQRDLKTFEIHITKCLPEDAVRARMSMHLQSGSASAALECLAQFETSVNTNLSADILRLKALALLLTKEVSQALAIIDEALALQPKWRYSKFVSGIIRYYAALSHVEIPATIPPWPAPVDWSLVKNNDEGRLRLDEAVKSFSDVLDNFSTRSEENQQIRGWLIASLASNTITQKEAQRACENILRENCCDDAAIAWSVARKYAINFDQSVTELNIRLGQGTISVCETISLVQLYLHNGRFSDADALMAAQKQSFENASQDALWRIWKSQTLLLNQKTEEAISLFGGMDNFPPELLPLIRDDAFRHDLLRRSASVKLEGRALFSKCIAMAMDQNWQGIAALSQELVLEVQTQEAVRLAAESLHSVGEYSQCIEILEGNSLVFNSGLLPHDLQTVLADCLHKLGRVNAALEKARKAAEANENTQTLLYYARMLFNTGNLKALVVIVKRLLKRRDLTGVHAIRLAESVYRDDQETAIKLWRHAVHSSLKGDDVFLAVTLGYQLGLEHEPSYFALQHQLKSLAQEGNTSAKLVSLDEIRATVQQRHAANEARWNAYREGQGIAHVLVDIPRIFQVSSRIGVKRLSLFNSHIVFAIHEDRRALLNIQAPVIQWKLNVDITALILAERYHFLDKVVEKLGPINISSEAITSLLFYRQMHSEIPSDRRKSLDSIKTALDSSKIKIFDQPTMDLTGLSHIQITENILLQTIELAQQDNSFVVEILPSESSERLFAAAWTVVADCQTIMKQVQSKLHLSTTEYESIVSQLPQAAIPTVNSSLAIGSKIYTNITLLEVFAKANALEYVLDLFNVYVPKFQADHVRFEIESDTDLHESSLWLTALIGKLGSWIDEEKIYCLPYKDGEHEDETPPIQSLNSLLDFSGGPPNAVWIDDRFANIYLQQGKGLPIVSTWEILSALNKSGEDMTFYYETLTSLRAANIRYLPILQHEIFYHLQQASVNERGDLAETTELKILKEYVAACIAQSSLMHKRQPDDAPIAFLGVLKQSLFLTWCEVWTAIEPFETKLARADWLVDDLFMDPISLSLLCNQKLTDASIAKTICEFLLAGLFIIPKAGEQDSRRYLEWVDRHFLSRLLRDYPELSTEVVTQLKEYLAVSMQDSQTNHDLSSLFRWWSKQFPAALKSLLQKDRDLMSMFGLRTSTLGNIRGVTYEIDLLEQKVKEALSTGKIVGLTALEGDVNIAAQRNSEGKIELKVKDTNNVEYSLHGDEIQFLFDAPHSRRKALVKNRQWIDVDPDQFEAIASGLAYLEPPSSRIEQLRSWQEDNLLRCYAEIEARLRQNQRVDLDDLLPPSIDSLLNHYRMKAIGDIDIIEHIQQLLSSEPALAARLIAGLPIALPEELIHHINALPLADHKLLVRNLLNVTAPVAGFQLLRVLTAKENRYEPYKRLKQKLRKHFLSEDYIAYVKAFIAVLRWLNNRFGRWQQLRKLPWKRRLVLAWLHSSYIFDSLIQSVPLPSILQTFSKARYSLSSSFLDTHDPIRNDSASPFAISPEQFCLAGITYGLSDSDISNISDQLIEFALFKTEEEYWPKAELLLHHATSNAFSSFLTADYERLTRLIPEFSALSASAFREKVTLCLNQISKAADTNFWWLLLNVAAPASLSSEIIEFVIHLLDEKGLMSICRNSSSPVVPMLTITNLLRDIDDQHEKLFRQMEEIAKDLSSLFKDITESQIRDAQRQFYIGFVEAGLVLSRRADELHTEKFTGLMMRILDACPSFSLVLSTAIDSVWMDMPLTHAAGFWELRRRLLAQQKQLRPDDFNDQPDGCTESESTTGSLSRVSGSVD